MQMILVRDDRIINIDIGLTETQINPSDYICKIIETLNFFNTNFNNNENNHLSVISSSFYLSRNMLSPTEYCIHFNFS